MAVPVLESSDSASIVQGLSIQVPIPSGTASGDLLILLGVVDGNYDLNTPSGWTQIHAVTSGVGFATFYRIADGTEGADVTLSVNGTIAQDVLGITLRISGHDPTTPINADTLANNTGATQEFTEVTTTSDECLVISSVGFDGGDATHSITTGGGSYTIQQTLRSATANNNATLLYLTSEEATAGTAATLTMSSGISDQWVASQIAITPAVVGGGGTPVVANGTPASAAFTALDGAAALVAPTTGVGDIGHWRDSAGGQNPGTSFGGPFDFATEIRNDSSAYTRTGAGTFQVNEAGHYLITASLKWDGDHNDRANPQAQAALSGSGTLWTTARTGYMRDTSEDIAWAKVTAVVHNASAGDVISIETRRGSSAITTGGSVAGASDIQIVRIDHDAIGMYEPAVVGQSYGGTIPNTVDIGTTVVQTDAARIERSGNTVTMKTSGARYLILSGVAWGGASNRTQRWSYHSYANAQTAESPRDYAYGRNGSNPYLGTGVVDVVEHSGGSDPTVTVLAYRGDGVANGQGGADADGGATTQALAGLCVIELPSSVEVLRSTDGLGGQLLTSTTPVDATVFHQTQIIDSASFAVSANTTLTAQADMDLLAVAQISAARQNVSAGARLTAYANAEIDGVDQTVGEGGNYSRGNQGTIDTFGLAMTVLGIYPMTNGQQLQIEGRKLDAASEAGGSDTTVAGWSGFVGINLATFAATAGTPVVANATPAEAAFASLDGAAARQAATVADGTPATATFTALDAVAAPRAAVVANGLPATGAFTGLDGSAALQVPVVADGTPAAAAFTALDGATSPQAPVVANGTPAQAAFVGVDGSTGAAASVIANGTPATAAFTALDGATVRQDAVVANGAPATATWSALDAGTAQGVPVVANGTSATAVFESLDASSTPQPATVANGPSADAAFQALDAQGALALPGGAAATPAQATFVALDGGTALQAPVVANGASAVATFGALDAQGVLEPAVSADGTPASATWSALDGATARQSPLVATGSPAGALFVAVNAGAGPTQTFANAIPAEARFDAIDGAGVAGAAVVANAVPAQATFEALDGSSVLEPAVVATAIPASSTWSALDAAGVVQAPLVASGTPAVASWQALEALGTPADAVVANATPAVATFLALDARGESDRTLLLDGPLFAVATPVESVVIGAPVELAALAAPVDGTFIEAPALTDATATPIPYRFIAAPEGS